MAARLLLRLAPLLALAAALVPRAAEAHVKWFVDPGKFPTQLGLIASNRTLLVLGAGLAVVAVLYLAQRALGDPHWPRLPIFRQMAVGAPALLSVHAAIALVFVAVQPALLGPHLMLTGPGLALSAVEAAIALSFVTGLLDWLGAIALVVLVVAVAVLFSPMDAWDQLLWVGIAAVVLVIGRTAVSAGHARQWFRERGLGRTWPARAVAALRILAGLALVGPAFGEKIWNPAIGTAFLADYPHFNVMRNLFGLDWFSDDLFVLCAGVAEAAIGIALASGLLTRVVILGMWLPFNATVPFLPPKELLGHLPIFGIMYFLLVHSSGIAAGETAGESAPGDATTPPGMPTTDQELRRAGASLAAG